MNGPGIAVLGILDEENHEKRDNRCAGIDDQLPGIGVVEDGAGKAPDDYDPDGGDKRPPGTEEVRTLRSKPAEPVGTGDHRGWGGDLYCNFGCFHNALRAVAYPAATLRSLTRLAV